MAAGTSAHGQQQHQPAVAPALVIGGLIVVALALRLPSFGDSLAGDDLSTNYVVNGFGVTDLFGVLQSDQEGTPPLFFMLTWLTKSFGDVEGLRTVSLLAGLASIPLTYLLGARTVGRPAGMVAAALVALSPFQVFYATEARAYALLMALTLAATLALLIAIESGRTRWWVAYALAAAASVYTHYPSVFVLIALFAWAFIARAEARKPLLIATAGAALLFAPWFPEFIRDGDAPAAQVLDILHHFSLHSAANDVLHWAIGHPTIPVSVVPGHLALWLMIAGMLAGGVGLALRLQSDGEDDRIWPPSAGLLLLVALVVASPLGAAIHQVFEPSVFFPRNLIASWPALALLCGAVVCAGRPPLRYAAVGLLLAGVAIGGVKMLDADNRRPDYLGAVAFIEDNGEPGSPVVDQAGGTPGPQTPLEAAFAPRGEAGPSDREILTLGMPPLQRRLDTRLDDLPVLDPLFTLGPDVPTDREVARRVAVLAGDGEIFLVSQGPTDLEQLRTVPGNVASFLNALPPRFHQVDVRTFPGAQAFPVTVHVLSGDPGEKGR